MVQAASEVRSDEVFHLMLGTLQKKSAEEQENLLCQGDRGSSGIWTWWSGQCELPGGPCSTPTEHAGTLLRIPKQVLCKPRSYAQGACLETICWKMDLSAGSTKGAFTPCPAGEGCRHSVPSWQRAQLVTPWGWSHNDGLIMTVS